MDRVVSWADEDTLVVPVRQISSIVMRAWECSSVFVFLNWMLTSASIFPVFCTCSLCGVGAFPTLCAFIQFKLSLLNTCLFVKLLYYCDHKLFWSVIWCHGVLSRDFCPSARRMYDGVFQILQNSSSLELAVASFHLLTELGKVKCSLLFPPSVCHLSASSTVPCSAALLSVDLGSSIIYNDNVLF